MKKTSRPLALIIIIVLILMTGCTGGGTTASGGKLIVCATVYPVYDFAKNIGGDRIDLYQLLPPGAEPHHWEPSPGDMVKVSRAGVLVYSGAGLETWLDSVLGSVDQGKTTVVDASRGVELMPAGSEHEHEGEEMRPGTSDPHIWLDPVNARRMVDNILEGLVRADPANRDYYTANAEAYKARLDDLDTRYRAALSGAKIKEFVVSHDAFGYLARRYGLQQIPARGLSADTEPSPARMADIVSTVKEYRIKYIFCEALVSPRVSETIAREAGVGTLVLDPAGGVTGDAMSRGRDYLKIMEDNLENLKLACEAGGGK